MLKPYLSVVIPCYNEEANLKRGVLEQVHGYLNKQRFSWEVLISDDGSTDRSRELISEFCRRNKNFTLIDNKHRGKPYALRSGIEKAKGRYVLLTDMDQSTPIAEFDKLKLWLDDGYDVVIGSRGAERENFSWFRQLASVVFRRFRQIFLLSGISDTQCGFKAFRAVVLRTLFSSLQVFAGQASGAGGWRVTAYDVELLFLAQKRKYKTKEVEVKWRDEDVSTSKGRKFIRESLNMLKEIFRVKWNDVKGAYD